MMLQENYMEIFDVNVGLAVKVALPHRALYRRSVRSYKLPVKTDVEKQKEKKVSGKSEMCESPRERGRDGDRNRLRTCAVCDPGQHALYSIG